MSRGHTLLELATVLALMAATLAISSPSLRRHRDAWATVAAREAFVGVIARARVFAVARGGAKVHIRASPPSARVVVGADTVWAESIRATMGVRVELGGRDSVVIDYDEAGLGRMANTTVRFRKGAAERGLVVSTYGRVRRR